MRSLTKPSRPWSLARRMLLAQWVVLALVTVVAVVGSYVQTRSTVFRSEGDNLLSISTLAVHEPEVIEAYQHAESSSKTVALVPVSQRIMKDTGADFATFMDRDGVRLTYHRPGYIGTDYPGTLKPASTEGKGFTETSSTATAGLSVRAVVPVKDADSHLVGFLTVGRTVGAVQVVAASSVPQTLAVALAIAALLAGVTWFEARYLRRVTNGLGPEQLAQHFAAADAALITVDEGIVIADQEGRIVFHNRAADALLGLHRVSVPDGGSARGASPRGMSPEGLTPAELGLEGPLAELIQSGKIVEDQAHTIHGRVVVVQQQSLRRPLRKTGRWKRRAVDTERRGWVLTVHDHTAVQRLSGELATTRSLTTALRAQNHDHANRLHTLLGLLEIDRVDEAHAMLRSSVGSPVASAPRADGADGDVVLTALLHGKAAEAAERGIEWETDVRLDRGTGLPPEDVVAIFGNLVDNALDAAAEADSPAERWVRVEVSVEEPEPGDQSDRSWLVASVSDGGHGFADEDAERIFAAGFSTKPADAAGRGQGLAIVVSVCSRLGGTVSAAQDSGTVFTVELPMPGPVTTAARKNA